VFLERREQQHPWPTVEVEVTFDGKHCESEYILGDVGRPRSWKRDDPNELSLDQVCDRGRYRKLVFAVIDTGE
jgi:hypothetical protein